VCARSAQRFRAEKQAAGQHAGNRRRIKRRAFESGTQSARAGGEKMDNHEGRRAPPTGSSGQQNDFKVEPRDAVKSTKATDRACHYSSCLRIAMIKKQARRVVPNIRRSCAMWFAKHQHAREGAEFRQLRMRLGKMPALAPIRGPIPFDGLVSLLIPKAHS